MMIIITIINEPAGDNALINPNRLIVKLLIDIKF